MFRERASVEALFTNGTGNAELEIAYATQMTHTVHIVLALLAAAAAVLVLGRSFPLWSIGAGLALFALVMIAFATRSWISIWNGALAGVVLATVALAWTRLLKGRKA